MDRARKESKGKVTAGKERGEEGKTEKRKG